MEGPAKPCPRCGAPLPPGSGAIRCAACGHAVARGNGQPAPRGPVDFRVVRRPSAPRPQPAPRRTSTLTRVTRAPEGGVITAPPPLLPAQPPPLAPDAAATEVPAAQGRRRRKREDGNGDAAVAAGAAAVPAQPEETGPAFEPQIEITLPSTMELYAPPEVQEEPELEPLRPAPTILPDSMETLASLVRAAPPEPGIQLAPYAWDDLMDGTPPPLPNSGEGAYSVYHAIDVDQDVRITYATVVGVRTVQRRAEKTVSHRIVVDSRVNVQKRALLEMMDAARARADQNANKQRAALGKKLSRKRTRVMQWPRLLTPLGFALIRTRAKMSMGVIQTRRKLRHGLVEIPDALFSSALRVQYHVGDRLARRSLFQAIRDPTTMNQEQRSVTLFLTAVAVGFVVLLLNSVVALAMPERADVYRAMLTDAALQFIGLLGAPILIEPLFITRAIGMGFPIAFAGFFIGKMLGAWVLYLLGDSLHHHIEKKTKGKSAKRMVTWLKANANRYGFLVLVLDNSLPLAPDQLMLVLAVSGIKFRSWMWGIALGTTIKFAAILAGIYYLGPEQVEQFFHNPFA